VWSLKLVESGAQEGDKTTLEAPYPTAIARNQNEADQCQFFVSSKTCLCSKRKQEKAGGDGTTLATPLAPLPHHPTLYVQNAAPDGIVPVTTLQRFYPAAFWLLTPLSLLSSSLQTDNLNIAVE
jgi:hypothetical protein